MKTFIASGGSRNRKRILDAINVSMNENFNIKIYERLSLKLIKKIIFCVDNKQALFKFALILYNSIFISINEIIKSGETFFHSNSIKCCLCII